MPIFAESVGSYPRVGDAAPLQRYRRAIQKHQSGGISDGELKAAGDEMVRLAVEAQAQAGLDVLTDGQIFWHDPVSHAMRNLAGVEITGLVRFFDTNTYFRQPRIRALPEADGPILVDDYRAAAGLARPKPVKPVLMGPYSLTKLSVLDGVDERAVEARLTEILAAEIERLRRAGATRIQIDEPALLRAPRDVERVNADLKQLGDVGVHLYFGDAAPVAQALLDGPAAWVGFDLSYSPSLLGALGRRRKPVLFGCIDARTTRREDPVTVIRELRPVVQDGDSVAPSTGLEYLPRDRAEQKLRLVAAVRDLL